ncbi:MAG: tRNA (guanosine(37)-N1)-methyltransferase TrmD [Bacilli bacterium]|jgi:tRNA (guanine37-N1)-methyltransferase
MKITILTLFPEMFEGFLSTSIIKRAIAKEAVAVEVVDIRSFTKDKYHRVDDYPVGGGAGLVMKCQPLLDALAHVRNATSHVVMMSPRGKTFVQAHAKAYAQETHLILVCGHYEGVDERVTPYVDEELSIGDYILTGGELASMVVSDAVIRLLEGAIRAESSLEESFEENLLEYPQYTLPRRYKGQEIPPILFSGNHAAIAKWRRKEQLRITRTKRPDLYATHPLTKLEKKLVIELDEGIENPPWLLRAIENAPQFQRVDDEEVEKDK